MNGLRQAINCLTMFMKTNDRKTAEDILLDIANRGYEHGIVAERNKAAFSHGSLTPQFKHLPQALAQLKAAIDEAMPEDNPCGSPLGEIGFEMGKNEYKSNLYKRLGFTESEDKDGK